MFARKKRYTAEQRSLLELRTLLATSPVTWTDADIERMASASDLTVADLQAQRAKLDGAGRFGAEGIEALEKYVQDSGREAELRKLLEINGPLTTAAATSRTYGGVFPSTMAAIAKIDAELGG